MSSHNAVPSFASCQLLVHPPAGGAWNMAVDEALLNAAVRSGLPTLRFYRWQCPTLSLGYFQKAADRTMHRPSLEADVVRRLSGGGAILHDQELTYSLVVPTSHELSRDTQSLYDAVHHTIRAALNERFAAAQSTWRVERCERPLEVRDPDEPFLCFQRRSVGDLLLRKNEAGRPTDEYKIVGSAQRRRQGAVLQHGSILLGRSKVSPELHGIAEITHLNVSPADLLSQLPERLARHLCIELIPDDLPEELVRHVEDLQQLKYQSPHWTLRC